MSKKNQFSLYDGSPKLGWINLEILTDKNKGANFIGRAACQKLKIRMKVSGGQRWLASRSGAGCCQGGFIQICKAQYKPYWDSHGHHFPSFWEEIALVFAFLKFPKLVEQRRLAMCGPLGLYNVDMQTHPPIQCICENVGFLLWELSNGPLIM